MTNDKIQNSNVKFQNRSFVICYLCFELILNFVLWYLDLTEREINYEVIYRYGKY